MLFLPDEARFSKLLDLPESKDLGKAINAAMKAIEDENSELAGVLLKIYNRLDNALFVELLKKFSVIAMEASNHEFNVSSKIKEVNFLPRLL